MYSKKIIILLCSLSMLLVLASCGDKEGCTDMGALNFDADAEESADVCEYPNINFHFHPNLSGDAFVYGNTYTINGLDVRIDQIRFYMTELEVTIDDAPQTFDKQFIVTETSGDQTAGEALVGTLSKVAFNIGVPEALNNADPALLPSDNPLSADSPNIQHWSWTAGYKFLVIEGAVDTNADGTFDIDTESMSIHCGFNDNLKRIELNADQSIDKENNELHLEFDVAKFFTNYDLANNLFSRPSNNPEAATDLMNNVQNAFGIE